MKHERILAVHDISCVGRCSLTVALPIISSVGIEVSGLPTAVLSTHTGGLTGYTYRDLTDDMIPIDRHWMSLGIKFDAIYTGFLGSFEQIDIVLRLFDDLSAEGTRIYVDPVMADGGKLYPVFGADFPSGMRKLCERADVIMPNLTELCLMLGEEWRDGPYTEEYISSMLDKAGAFGVRKIVLTGISYEPGTVGAVYRDFETGETGSVMRHEVPGYYHGTGDVFSSALVGACECGLPLAKAVEAAVELTVSSIVRTYAAGEDIRYGVDFEAGLRDYIRIVDAGRDLLIEAVTDDDSVREIAAIGERVWKETYTGLIPDGQAEYMIERYQSFGALREQIDEKGYTYLLARCHGVPVGYCGYVRDEKGIFLSKLYLLPESQGHGLATKLVDRVREAAVACGADIVHLTVNRDNAKAVRVYEHLGFVTVATADTPIGNGFYMNDYLMELKVGQRCSSPRPGRRWTASDGTRRTSSWCPGTPTRTTPTTAPPWSGTGWSTAVSG